MPTCTHIAYHQEAQRKARVQARRQEAILNQLRKQEEEDRARLEEEKRLNREKHDREDARRREREQHLRRRGKGGMNELITSQKDLRYQQKVLRDHGLVMGHVNGEFLS